MNCWLLESKEVLEERSATEKRDNDSYELTVINKKEEKRHWLTSGAPNYNINGEIIGSIGIH
jgi:hypothetical protein